MYASVLRSETIGPAGPQRQRADGRVELTAVRVGSVTRLSRVAEAGSLRLRLPRVPGPDLEAVLINTGGGIACGDRFTVKIDAAEGAQLVVTTPAAEKVYRSDGPNAELSVRLTLAAGAQVAWMPQETIVFDRARIRRRIDVELAPDSRLFLFEPVVFGRTARGEEVRYGFFEDRWRIRRGGRLVFADTLRFDGPVAALLDRPPLGGGARALAACLYVAPDAEERIEEVRRLLQASGGGSGASAWNGLLSVRFLAQSGAELRRDAAAFLEGFRGCALPRVWQS